MDFTFLFLVVLMVLAAQSNNLVLLLGLFVILLVTAKHSKYLLGSAVIGLAIAFLWNADFAGAYKTPVLLGGLFLVLLLLIKSDSGQPQPMGGAYGYM